MQYGKNINSAVHGGKLPELLDSVIHAGADIGLVILDSPQLRSI